MLPRITTVRPRTLYPGMGLRAWDVTIVDPCHRATYTVLAKTGKEANAQASALFDGHAQPFRLPDLAVA